MSPETILAKVKAVLEANVTLAAYNRRVFLGDLSSNLGDSFPNITIEPTANATDRVLPDNIRENILTLTIAGAVLCRDKTLAVVGDATHVGITDHETNIKAALFAKFPDLDKTCLYFALSTDGYAEMESGDGRIVLIEARFWYRES